VIWLSLLSPVRLIIAMLAGAVMILGMRACYDHDGRIRAEENAKAAKSKDSLLVEHWRQMYDAQASHVDTVVIATKQVLQPTREGIKTALERITDTVVVKASLEKADSTIRSCQDAVNACLLFRVGATKTIDSLSGLIARRDSERVRFFAPPRPARITKGVQLGIGYCIDATGRRVPCGYAGYGMSIRLP